MKNISEIKSYNKKTALIVGRGLSVDNVDWDALYKSEEYDICTLADAIKLVNPKFAFCVHLGVSRILHRIPKAKYFIVSDFLINECKRRDPDFIDVLNGYDNIYSFKNIICDEKIFLNNSTKENELFAGFGTIISALQFLVEKQGYKNIKFIGFDGGNQYGKKVSSYEHKLNKRKNAADSYEISWKVARAYTKSKKVSFAQLDKFLMGDIVDRRKLLDNEKTKYNLLHEEKKYGGTTGRVKMFFKAEDDFHILLKKNIRKMCSTMLDVGCGKGPFMRFFKEHYPHLKITGIDIADVKKFNPQYDIIQCSASNTPFEDNSFDIVIHTDGMEHIPREIEEEVLAEECRICKKFIWHSIAVHSVKHHDDKFENMGLGKVHINMRTAQEWKDRIDEYCEKYHLRILAWEDYKDWVHFFLEKLKR